METKTIRAAIAAALTIAASAILPSFADRTLNDGLAVYMPFDTSVTNNAAINSSVKPVKSGSPTSASGGAVGNCLNIPSGAYVTLNGTKTTVLPFENSNKSFTAIVWANYGTQTDDPAIWGNKDWGGGGKIGAVLATQKSGGAKFNAGNGKGSGTVRWDATFTGEGSGHWTFYAAVCTNGTFTIYQGKSDGTLTTQAGSLSGFTLATGNPFRLGQDGTGSYGHKFVGKLDDFALWTRSLSATQITNIYEAGLSGTALGGLLDNVIVATDTPGAEGAEASGGYRKDGAYTFTAPATTTVGDTVYNLLGYKLERWNQASVKWETVGEYTGGSFAYDSASYDTTIRLTWKWVPDTVPATATYIGLGNDPLDFDDPANWACTNVAGAVMADAVPGAETKVTVAGATAFQVTNGAAFVCASIKFDNATLPDGADLRGLDISKVTADSVIDLQGRTLLLGGANGTSADAFTVTNTSSGTPGTLRWEVAGSAVFTCGANLAGELKLRKEGTGTFVAAKTGQTYAGGTDVVAGTIKVGASGDGLFGTGVLSLPTGTTLELDGKTGCGSANVVLSGGTIQNNAAAGASLPRVLTLTADSKIKHANGSSGANDLNVPANCEWNLGGNKLTVSMAGNDNDFNFSEPSSGWNVMSNGTIKIEVGTSGSKNGYFQIRRLYGKDGLNLDIGTTYPRYRGDNWSSVWGYASNPISNANVLNTKSDGSSAGSAGSAGLEVYGLFKPQTTKSLNLKMMNGSTLDLSAKTGSFSCNFDNASIGGTQKLTFGSGNVTVDIHGRADLATLAAQTDSRVVTWSSKPASTTFALDAETRKRYKVKSESNGLYLKKLRGFVLIVQ